MKPSDPERWAADAGAKSNHLEQAAVVKKAHSSDCLLLKQKSPGNRQGILRVTFH